MPRNLPPLTRAVVLETALNILDQKGMEGLSMRKLAATLHVKAMSLYNHVKDKNDLLNGLVDLVLAQIELPDPALPWRDRLEAIALKLYQTLLKHPALAVIIASEQGSPRDTRVLEGLDNIISILEDSGLRPEHQVNAFRGLLAMCFGFVLSHTQGFSTTKELAEQDWAAWDSHKWDDANLPHLQKLAPYFLQTHADDDLRFMLRAYLDALEAASHKT